MRHIALATYAALPALAADELPLLAALDARGVRAEPAVWDDASVDWGDFDGVVIRSCWDYHLRHAEFFAWVHGLERRGVAVWNAPSLLAWNSRKTYLHELTYAGVRTVPTIWLIDDAARAPRPSLSALLDRTGWAMAVVKPIISASAHETWKVTRDELHADGDHHDGRLHALIAAGGVMVQPFVPEIAADGEWSLQFFGGTFSHAVLKRAAIGEFRVQREYGGTHDPVVPAPRVVQQAGRALRASPGEPVYARVDGVVIGDDLVVTEVELLEPALFLDADEQAPVRFADAILAALPTAR